MSMISEQINRLRKLAKTLEEGGWNVDVLQLVNELRCSADTIEELSAKLASANMERSTVYYNDGWIPCSKQLPPHSDDLLLIQCSGKPKNNIVFDNAFCLASYTKEGWLLELYPEWKGAEVIAWQPLPEPFKPKGE